MMAVLGLVLPHDQKHWEMVAKNRNGLLPIDNPDLMMARRLPEIQANMSNFRHNTKTPAALRPQGSHISHIYGSN